MAILLKKQYNLDITHAKMVQEMANAHARSRGQSRDSDLTMARMIEAFYHAWKRQPSILRDEAASAESQQALVRYGEVE